MSQASSWDALQVFILPWRLPDGADDSTQLLIRIGFATVIFGLTLITVIALVRNAKETSWDQNWKGSALAGGRSGHLDVEHGSVSDICFAVRTRSEALAAAMPGVLLVIGLLGTFIGLGLALTDASLAITALADAGTPPSAVSGALGDMMKGLGYKFATSTWGIIGYLVLRTVSAFGGYEERRLRWSIGKMRAALDDDRQRRAGADTKQQDLFANLLSEILKSARATVVSSEAVRKSSDAIQASSAGSEKAMTRFLDGMNANLREMGTSSASMATSADSVGKSAVLLGASAALLQSTVETFDSSVSQTLDKVRTDLTGAISTLQSTTTESMTAIADNLGKVTGGLSTTLANIQTELKTTLEDIQTQTVKSNASVATAIADLSGSVDRTLNKLQATLVQMEESTRSANAAFKASTGQILELVGTTDNLVKSVKQDIVVALGVVASGSTETRKIFTRYERIAARNDAATVALVDALGSIPVSANPHLPHVRGRSFRLVRVPRRGWPK